MKTLISILALALLSPFAAQQPPQIVRGSGSISVSFTVPERASMSAVLSPDKSEWLVAVDFNLIHPPTVLLVESDGVFYERECSHERCTEPLTAMGRATFGIPVNKAEPQQTLTLVLV